MLELLLVAFDLSLRTGNVKPFATITNAPFDFSLAPRTQLTFDLSLGTGNIRLFVELGATCHS